MERKLSDLPAIREAELTVMKKLGKGATALTWLGLFRERSVCIKVQWVKCFGMSPSGSLWHTRRADGRRRRSIVELNVTL